jgi:hypothetical protein
MNNAGGNLPLVSVKLAVNLSLEYVTLAVYGYNIIRLPTP